MKTIRKMSKPLFKMLNAFSKSLLNLIKTMLKLIKKIPKSCWRLAKKYWFLFRNPRCVCHFLVVGFKKIKSFFKRLPKNTKEYFFWLLMSPENNILRLKRRHIADIPTAAEIKEYQRYLRKKTAKFAFTGAMAVMLVISLPGLFQRYFAHSKTYQWVQTSWSGGPTSPTEMSTNLLTGWTKYFSPSNTNLIGADGSGYASLKSVAPAQVTEGPSYAGSSTTSGTYVSGSTLSLKKPTGAAGSATECASGFSNAGACCADACCGASIVDVRGAESITYPIIAIGNQCWFAENLRTTKTPPSPALNPLTDISAVAYCNPTLGCSAPRGRLYAWDIAMNGETAAAAIGAKIQGICPAGWHIPSDFNADASDDWQKLSNFLGGDSVAGGKMKRTEVPTYWSSPNTLWSTPNVGVTNNNGFAGIGDGYWSSGYTYAGSYGIFWSSIDNGSNAWGRTLNYNNTLFSRSAQGKTSALSVRCVKN